MNDMRAESPNHDPLEDDFTLALIDSVQRNPCVYNRYDPLHKITDYKHEIWKMISLEIGYDGQPVELERKWKHMRDKYVRLRKQDKQKAPIKKNNKWYNYYHKMSFLDPYVEHRNRKRQKEYMSSSPEILDDEMMYLDDLSVREILKPEIIGNDLGHGSPPTSSCSSSGGNINGIFNDSVMDEMDEEKKNLVLLYDKIMAEQAENGNNNNRSMLTAISSVAPTSITAVQGSSRKRKPIPVQIRADSPPLEKVKAEALEDLLKEPDEDQVTLFIRSIARTMNEMDRKKFAMARVEISKVLYKIEFGKIQYNESSAM